MTTYYEPAEIPRVCHEANRALQALMDEPQVSPPWDEAPEWQTSSAVEGVQKALDGATSEELHESWCDFKAQSGWTYGPTKDEVPKTHPCLVSYADLPEDQKIKDRLFAAIVGALS